MWYWILLITTAVLAGIFAIRDAAVVFGVLTFGLGFLIVFFLVNFLPLLLAFLPRMVFPKPLKTVGLVLGLLLYLAYLFVPPYLANQRAAEIRAQVALEDIQPEKLPDGIRSFELSYSREVNNDICTLSCKSLIASGDADWVRVNYAKGISHTFVRETGTQSCSDNCVTVAKDTGLPADLTLSETVIKVPDLKEKFPNTASLKIFDITRMEVFLGGGGTQPPIYRKNRLRYHLMMTPTVIQPYLTGTTSDGYEFAIGGSPGPDVTHLATLRNLGFASGTAPTPTPFVGKAVPTSLERSAAVLALDSDSETLSDSDQMAIAQYMRQVRWHDPIPTEDLDLIEKVINEKRFRKSIQLQGILKDAPEFRVRVLPAIYDRFENSASEKPQIHYAMLNGLRFGYLGNELAPFFDRYKNLIEISDNIEPGMASLVGLFGADPADAFRTILRKSDDDLQVAKEAVCYANPRWRKAMMPDLLRAFEEQVTSGNADRIGQTVSEIAYVGSIMGYRSKIEALLRSNDFGSDKFWHRMEKYEDRPEFFKEAC